jgi:hypothetical protein
MLMTLILLCALAGASLLIWGIIENVHPYYSIPARLRRSSQKMMRRQRESMEDFKTEIHEIMRR